jgi:hypothetical protein
MITALERWHHPDAAEKIAGHLVAAMVKNGVPMPVRPNAEAEAESPAPKAGVNVVEKLQVA